MRILLFGSLREKLQTDMFDVTTSQNVSGLKEKLEKEFSLLKDEQYSIAVNQKICSDASQTLNEEDIVALLPPFSGG